MEKGTKGTVPFVPLRGKLEKTPGIPYNDATGKRTPKDSLTWYAETIRCDGENL